MNEWKCDEIKPNELGVSTTWDEVRIIDGDEPFDPMWGLDLIQLTLEDVEALKQGKYAYTCNGEYAQLIRIKEAPYERMERDDHDL